jgi:hypothetical protein
VAGYPERERPFTLSVDESGLVRLAWRPGTRIDRELARRSMDDVDELNAGRHRPLLVDMNGAGLDREARLVFTQEVSASRIALLGGTPVDRVVANFALSVSRMAVPIRFFSAEPDAVSWLFGDARTG